MDSVDESSIGQVLDFVSIRRGFLNDFKRSFPDAVELISLPHDSVVV